LWLTVLFLVAWDITLISNISFQLSVFSTIGVIAINSQNDPLGDGMVTPFQSRPPKDEDFSHSKINRSNNSTSSIDHRIQSHVPLCECNCDPNLVDHSAIVHTSKLQKLFHHFSQTAAVFKESFQTTLVANIFTLPIILFWFGRVSVIALIANTALLWIIPWIMYASSVFVVASMLHHSLASLASIPIKVLTNLFLWGVGFFARVPFASFDVPKINFLHVVLSYGCLFVVFRYFKRFRNFLSRKT
jgi:hypothetical protein